MHSQIAICDGRMTVQFYTALKSCSLAVYQLYTLACDYKYLL
jgi:hypothetical protein